MLIRMLFLPCDCLSMDPPVDAAALQQILPLNSEKLLQRQGGEKKKWSLKEGS